MSARYLFVFASLAFSIVYADNAGLAPNAIDGSGIGSIGLEDIDGSGIASASPQVIDGSGIQASIIDGSGINQVSNPLIIDGSGISDATELLVIDGSGIDTASPLIIDGSGISNAIPLDIDGSGIAARSLASVPTNRSGLKPKIIDGSGILSETFEASPVSRSLGMSREEIRQKLQALTEISVSISVGNANGDDAAELSASAVSLNAPSRVSNSKSQIN
ncbi:MAG: hypothetical protein HKN49_08485 [Gammaproteobacteria bacterium]|nr:hypothetical protein [Gammaproteobacteria bacterium]